MVKVDNSFQKLEEDFNKLNQQISELNGKKPVAKTENKQAETKQNDTVIKTSDAGASASAEMPEPTASDVGLESQSLPQASWRNESSNQTSSKNAKACKSSGFDNQAGEASNKSAGKASTGSKASTGKASAGKASSDDDWLDMDPSSFAMTIATDSELLNSYDDSLKQQAQGKKLLMLLMYLLKASESGDLNTFYNLMKVVTLIISRDRAIQNSYLVKKVIQLQEQNREQNQILANADTTDSEQFMKILQNTRAEMETISMSQKLLTTMMEETKDVMSSYSTLTHNLLQADSQLQKEMLRWN